MTEQNNWDDNENDSEDALDDEVEAFWDEQRYFPNPERDLQRIALAIGAMNEAHGFSLRLTLEFDADLTSYEMLHCVAEMDEEAMLDEVGRLPKHTTTSVQFSVPETAAYPDVLLREMIVRCVAFAIRHLTYDPRPATWCRYWGQCTLYDGNGGISRMHSPFGVSGFVHGFGEFTDRIDLQSPLYYSQLVREVRLPDVTEIRLFVAPFAETPQPTSFARDYQNGPGRTAVWRKPKDSMIAAARNSPEQ